MWAQDVAGVRLSTPIAIRDYNHLYGMGFGLQLVGDPIQKGELILRAPMASCIVSESLTP